MAKPDTWVYPYDLTHDEPYDPLRPINKPDWIDIEVRPRRHVPMQRHQLAALGENVKVGVTDEPNKVHFIDIFGAWWCDTEGEYVDTPQNCGWEDDPAEWDWCDACLDAAYKELGDDAA